MCEKSKSDSGKAFWHLYFQRIGMYMNIVEYYFATLQMYNY